MNKKGAGWSQPPQQHQPPAGSAPYPTASGAPPYYAPTGAAAPYPPPQSSAPYPPPGGAAKGPSGPYPPQGVPAPYPGAGSSGYPQAQMVVAGMNTPGMVTYKILYFLSVKVIAFLKSKKL